MRRKTFCLPYIETNMVNYQVYFTFLNFKSLVQKYQKAEILLPPYVINFVNFPLLSKLSTMLISNLPSFESSLSNAMNSSLTFTLSSPSVEYIVNNHGLYINTKYCNVCSIC